MPPSVPDRLRHIADAIGEIDRQLTGRSYDEFSADRFLQLGIERCLEIVSEAVRHVPDDAKASRPEIPWRRIADLGNRLRHAYHAIDSRIVWEIATVEISELRRAIEQMIEKPTDLKK